MEPVTAASTEPFTVIRELGRGGMGVVYLAEDHKRGDRCAVKLLHSHLTLDDAMVTRFRTEARAASAIDHPAIVKIRGDISRLVDGRWYCMMEYLDGLTLAQFMAQRGPLPLALVLEIIAPLCDALDQAHASGIIHRDLKPDNVMVLVRADAYAPKLLDFGIAKLRDEPGVTRPGVALGTVAYIAPEQTRGAVVDRRSDIYALGVLVYQMVTGGRLPYDAPDGALYHAQMTQPPIDPRRRAAGVPENAVGAILAAIHVDPTQRPGSAGAFALMLARILVGTSPQTDGMAILQRVAPRLLVTTNLHETLRAPGLSGARGSGAWGYEYVALLGRGGFGEVFRGVKLGDDGFALPVAIKRILREHAETPAFVEMFHQEARIAALVGAHPNIVKVLDHAKDPWGQLYIAMEFIDGVDLDKLRQSGPIPPSVVIFIISEVLEGLGYAHHLAPLPSGCSSADEIAARGQIRGIVHRDISHHNVMISWHGAVKVTDFGIAKLRQATVAPGSAMIKGKPGYLSPEQANAGVALDGRSDLFAVGIMLWELLTGHALFERENLQATLAAVLFDAIPRPTVVNAGVSLDLDAVVMRLLERDPDHRYQTARDAIAALAACASVSRSAKAELQELLRARFPETAAHAVLSPTRSALPSTGVRGSSEHTTHGHAVGQAVATLTHPVARWLKIGAATIGVGAAAVAVALVVGRYSHEPPGVETARGTAAPVTDGATSANPPVQPPLSASAVQPPVLPSSTARHLLSTTIIVTTPRDAMVRVEDATTLIAAGRAPLTVPVPSGAHLQIYAEASGYEPATRALTIGSEAPQTFTLVLTPTGRGVSSPPKTVQTPDRRSPPKPAGPPRSPAKQPESDEDQIIK